jgi:hypothetical protein
MKSDTLGTGLIVSKEFCRPGYEQKLVLHPLICDVLLGWQDALFASWVGLWDSIAILTVPDSHGIRLRVCEAHLPSEGEQAGGVVAHSQAQPLWIVVLQDAQGRHADLHTEGAQPTGHCSSIFVVRTAILP